MTDRLHSHLLAGNGLATPHDVVAHFGAMQAQDYLGALWAVGVRMQGEATEGEIERAIAERRIVRCWPMRGTLHFVAAEDVRWMLGLLAPRVLRRHGTRLERDFGLDTRTLRRCRTVAERMLRGGNASTRPELYAAFEAAGIATKGSRGLHILFALAHERVLCFGARRGKQPAFVLLDEWLPPSKPKPREEALAELATRYFRSHAPATPADFAWWSGLPLKEAKEAIGLSGATASQAVVNVKAVHILPPLRRIHRRLQRPHLDPRSKVRETPQRRRWHPQRRLSHRRHRDRHLETHPPWRWGGRDPRALPPPHHARDARGKPRDRPLRHLPRQ